MYNLDTDEPQSGSMLFTANAEYVGIDKIRLIYPVHQGYSDGSYDLFTKHRVTKTKGNGRLLDSLGTAAADPRASIYVELRNHGTEALIEFNPARQMDVAGDTLCHPDVVAATVIWVMQELSYVVMPRFAVNFQTQEILIDDWKKWEPGWMSLCRLTRLDLARDVYSPFPGFSIDSILNVSKTRYKNDYIYRNSGVNESITWGSKSGVRCTVYNKSLKHHKDAKGGWFRFEAQAHTEVLKRYGLRTLDGVCEARTNQLLWDKWNQSNMGNPVSTSDGAYDITEKLKGALADREVATFLGVAYAMYKGLPPVVSDKSLNKYRKIGMEMGFVLGNNLDTLGHRNVRIDFASGLIVDCEDNNEFRGTRQDSNGTIEPLEKHIELV